MPYVLPGTDPYEMGSKTSKLSPRYFSKLLALVFKCLLVKPTWMGFVSNSVPALGNLIGSHSILQFHPPTTLTLLHDTIPVHTIHPQNFVIRGSLSLCMHTESYPQIPSLVSTKWMSSFLVPTVSAVVWDWSTSTWTFTVYQSIVLMPVGCLFQAEYLDCGMIVCCSFQYWVSLKEEIKSTLKFILLYNVWYNSRMTAVNHNDFHIWMLTPCQALCLLTLWSRHCNYNLVIIVLLTKGTEFVNVWARVDCSPKLAAILMFRCSLPPCPHIALF